MANGNLLAIAIFRIASLSQYSYEWCGIHTHITVVQLASSIGTKLGFHGSNAKTCPAAFIGPAIQTCNMSISVLDLNL